MAVAFGRRTSRTPATRLEIEYAPSPSTPSSSAAERSPPPTEVCLSLPTYGTSNHTYEWAAMLTFPIPPQKWGIFIVHNTGVALNATGGNHEVKHTPVKFVSA